MIPNERLEKLANLDGKDNDHSGFDIIDYGHTWLDFGVEMAQELLYIRKTNKESLENLKHGLEDCIE